MRQRILDFVILVTLIPVVAGGCLIGSSSTESRDGRYVSESTFDQITPGETTKGWIVATMGQPTSKANVDDGAEIWKWSYTQTKNSSGYVFLLFGGNNTKVSDGTVFVELKDGVVTKAWRG